MYRIKTMVAVLLCAGLFTACQDFNTDNISNEMPHYVYTPTGATEIKVSITDMIEDGQFNASFEFKVSYGVADDKTATVEATVGPDLSLVDAYNKEKAKSYKPFPLEFIDFTQTSVNISSGSDIASVTFKMINFDMLRKGEYLLPITIKSVKASNGFPLHEKQKTAYYQISKQQKLKVIDYSDNEPTDGQGPWSILDGNPNTFWHSGYEDGIAPCPHWVILDLGGPSTVVGAEIIRRNNGDTRKFEWYLNDDSPAPNDAGWRLVAKGEFMSQGAPHAITKYFNPESGRYMKLMLLDGYRWQGFIGVVGVSVFFGD